MATASATSSSRGSPGATSSRGSGAGVASRAAQEAALLSEAFGTSPARPQPKNADEHDGDSVQVAIVLQEEDIPIRPAKPLAYSGAGPEPLPPEPAVSTSVTLKPLSLRKASRPAGSISSSTRDRETAAAQRLLGYASASEASWHLRCLPDLTWEDRLMGFAFCFAVGLALSLSSIFSFPQLLLGDPAPFAWKYSIGNVISLFSSSFLVGFEAQLEQMASPVRLGATALYVCSIAATVFAALGLRNDWITVLAILVQFCALAWYCASYIPYGRFIIRQVVAKTCCPV